MASYWFGVSPNTVREISSQKETGHSGRHLGFQCSGVGGRRIKELRVLTDGKLECHFYPSRDVSEPAQTLEATGDISEAAGSPGDSLNSGLHLLEP